MQRRAILLVLVLPSFTSAANAVSPFAGRWDLTITTPKGSFPSWIEFADEGATPAVRMVGRTGSVHAVRGVKVEGSHLTFADPAWDLSVTDRKLTGRDARRHNRGRPRARAEQKPSRGLDPTRAAIQRPRSFRLGEQRRA